MTVIPRLFAAVTAACALTAGLLTIPTTASAAGPAAGPATGQAAAAPAQATYGELAVNGGFGTNTTGWWADSRVKLAASGGALQAAVTPRTDGKPAFVYDSVLGQDNIHVRKGATYTLSFDAKASADRPIRAVVGLNADPWDIALAEDVKLTTTSKRFTFTFTSKIGTTTGQIAFQVGGEKAATSVVLDNVSLTTSTAREGFYVDPLNNARTHVGNKTDPDSLKIKSAIGDRTTVKWYGNWNAATVESEVNTYVGDAAAKGQLPVIVAYNIPGRDCDGSSKGGAKDAVEYDKWIKKVASGIAGRPVIVVLEPDAVAQAGCMTGGTTKQERFNILRGALQTLKDQGPLVQTYLDAGNSTWTLGDDGKGDGKGGDIGLANMASMLNDSGVSLARGVSVGVSNFDATDISNAYGKRLADQLKSAHGVTTKWVVDTARNGNGAYVTPGVPSSGHVGFCNPAKRKLGVPSQTGTGGAEYLLWLKSPGDSDGDDAKFCPSGSLSAGAFDQKLALALINGS